MAKFGRLTIDEAHQHFARALNGETWELLSKPDRTPDEGERMVYAATASAYHWLHAGGGPEHQRAEWLIAHVYSVLGEAAPALRHARRCQALTEEHAAALHDFDRAYAHEALARALALAGEMDEARRYYRLAQEAGEAIQDEEDRSIFTGDFEAGPWFGLEGG